MIDIQKFFLLHSLQIEREIRTSSPFVTRKMAKQTFGLSTWNKKKEEMKRKSMCRISKIERRKKVACYPIK